ncbi:hypothetical protein [Archangium sp. Cb G35]|uniref:hypothetical protein n=1 Tax=Archangium sp. Cb G35 TaxID=1920190 RepID=UPI001161446E|nr:hypothetical protein [Archangium sp. Cb G35]
MALTEQQMDEVDAMLLTGNLIAAITIVRGHTGWELGRAKDFVEARLVHLRQAHAEHFRRLDAPPPRLFVDSTLMGQLHGVGHANVRPVSEVLRRLEQLVAGYNYSVTLDVKALDLPGEELPLIEVMRTCYPESRPHLSKVRRVSLEELKTDVDACLRYEGDESSGPRFTAARREKLERELLPAFWRALAELIPYEEAELHDYPDETGLPGYSVYWFFAYVLHDRMRRRCVVITGSSSD